MFDLLITGGRVVDGTGNAWYLADIGVVGDTIAAIGRLAGSQAKRHIDAAGLVVCPGFVDMHSHSDIAWLAAPDALAKVRQGVTTEIIGQDGISYAPVSPKNMPFWQDYLAGINGRLDSAPSWSSVAEFLDQFDAGVSVNLAYLIPHGAVRMEVLGLDNRQATDAELGQMAALVERGMREGAYGLSTGLFYLPAIYADTAELVALCRPVARFNGIYVTHMRNYRERIREAFEETCIISQMANVRAHISHYNTPAAVGLPLMTDARRRGVDVTYDSYPYLAGCTLLGSILPLWAQEGTVSDVVERLRQPENRQRLAAEIEAGYGRPYLRWENIFVAGVQSASNRRYEGLHIVQAATQAVKRIGEFVADLLVEERCAVAVISHQTHFRTEADMRTLLQQREQMVGSDGVLLGGHPHPRGYGAFPRILGVYVRQESVLSLEEAVRKMTWAPACRIGLARRGLLVEGWKADVTCFDPESVIDRATYEQGSEAPEGIVYVIVNGQVVMDCGQHTGVHSGKALRRDDRDGREPKS
jgi:N-acyl-D-amino-acid deacylase